MHGVENVAVVGVDFPGKQAAELVGQHVLSLGFDRTVVIEGDELTGGCLEHIGCLGNFVVAVLPVTGHLALGDATVVDDPLLPDTFRFGARYGAGGGAGEGIVALITTDAGPATAIHGRADHYFARFDALTQQCLHPLVRGVAGIGIPASVIQGGLVTQLSVGPGAVEVVAHQEDVIHVLLGGAIIHLGNLVIASTDGGSELVGAARLCAQLVEHGAQLLHQEHIGLAIGGIAKIRVGSLATRELPVDVHPVEEFPGLQVLFHRGDEGVALGLVTKEEEGVGEGPAADGGENLQVRIGLFERHQVAEVALVRLVIGGEIALPHLDGSPGIVDGDLEVLPPGAGALQRLETAGDGLETVVDAIAATDGGKAVKNVSQVLGRDLVHGELAAIDAPLHIVGPHHLAGFVGVRFVVLLQRSLERHQMAAICVGHQNFFLVGESATIGIAQGHLHLVAASLGHLEVGGARG